MCLHFPPISSKQSQKPVKYNEKATHSGSGRSSGSSPTSCFSPQGEWPRSLVFDRRVFLLFGGSVVWFPRPLCLASQSQQPLEETVEGDYSQWTLIFNLILFACIPLFAFKTTLRTCTPVWSTLNFFCCYTRSHTMNFYRKCDEPSVSIATAKLNALLVLVLEECECSHSHSGRVYPMGKLSTAVGSTAESCPELFLPWNININANGYRTSTIQSVASPCVYWTSIVASIYKLCN